jgi:hypothetical protein
LIDRLVVQSDSPGTGSAPPGFDLRRTAIVETDDRARAGRYLGGASPDPSESVTVTQSAPQRVELRAVLDRPGLVILADTFYPGWHLTIDGAAASIERTNRLMRGAFVNSGTHILIYTYRPDSVRIGIGLSLLGVLCLLGGGYWARKSQRHL